MSMKFNERVWAGHLIAWIKELIVNGQTVFQDATNDLGIKLDSGTTKFPDILLFTDKNSGIIFNEWELKFPDTEVDDTEMLLNALEKSEKLKTDSFVTWNGSEAIIWKINNGIYEIGNLEKLKHYPKEIGISKRNDLADYSNYQKHEAKLKQRLIQIVHDLEQLYKSGELKEAINISFEFIEAIKRASEIIIPQFKTAIDELKGKDKSFRDEFNKWKIYESATIQILSSSSKKQEKIIPEDVLAKFSFYNLIGKILFYQTLSANLSGRVKKIEIVSGDVKTQLNNYFNEASKIDYQAVFKPYFTDILPYSNVINTTLIQLLNQFDTFDFTKLPTEVIGTILENLVPKDEKQKFGQYFTPETLANLSAFPAIQTNNDLIFDPTSGTGTFLNSAYQILKYHGKNNHNQLLNQIWGNDISHFPAILSVINLYKQQVKDKDNFPRVVRDDYFNLEVGKIITFPDSLDFTKQINEPIPLFNSIVSNFPFIQQEDIPNDKLTVFFRKKFESKQAAFLKDKSFKINERSDYFTYCVYNSVGFLKNEGYLSAITSNAWLGKEYGIQFKKFLLDNFSIKYIVKSNAEHWFLDSKVSTVFSLFKLGASKDPTKFITINFKLDEYFNQDDTQKQLEQIEEFYSDIDLCEDPKNTNWIKDASFKNVYHRKDNLVTVSIVSKDKLNESLITKGNWGTFFISDSLFDAFEPYLTKAYPKIYDTFRGERTGFNDMFIIPNNKIKDSGIENKFLIPLIKSPKNFHKIEFSNESKHTLFLCDKPLEDLKASDNGAYQWILKFKDQPNTKGDKTIEQANKGHKPFWYSQNPKKVNIVTAVNLYERHFFSYSEQPFMIDQRLIGINVKDSYDVILISALLNSVITALSIEMQGTARNLGALDLNANFFKSSKILNPDLLSPDKIEAIKQAFKPLKKRKILTVYQEVRQADRINFDKVILSSFGIDIKILPSLYQALTEAVKNRAEMKER